MSGRYVIFNADDFGYSRGINRGILEGHERGVVTSATLVVNGVATDEAARLARECPALAVGLHVNFTNEADRLLDLEDREACRAELRDQYSRFCDLIGGKPTHLDSHQHVHRSEPARTVLLELAAALGVPLRHYVERIAYCGDFYGQTTDGRPLHEAISVDGLIRTVSQLSPGVTELACHPASDEDIDSMYGPERMLELQALCDARVRDAIAAAGIELRSFRSFRDR